MADAAKACMGMFKLIRGASGGLEAFEKDVDKGLVPNPEFLKLIDMGFRFSGYSKKTEKYLGDRLNKQIGAALFSWSGAAASTVITVDVGTASLGAQSLALAGTYAYLEQADTGGDRPATEVMSETFRRRGVLGLFSLYDVNAIINEPAGCWHWRINSS